MLVLDNQEELRQRKQEENGWNYKTRNFDIFLSIIARVIMQKIMCYL
jgi:hypothetical protein